MRIAGEKGLFVPYFYNISDYSDRPQGRVDDAPYGGGAGQVMQVEPIYRAICEIESAHGKLHKVFLGPAGDSLTHEVSEGFAQKFGDKHILILCGHYEGVDARVFELFEWDVYRIGDYIVSSGEIAAMVFLDSIVRLLPGVVGNSDSLHEESFSSVLEGGIEYPHYTRPEIFEGLHVPEVLLSGDHKKIAKWRKEHIKSPS